MAKMSKNIYRSTEGENHVMAYSIYVPKAEVIKAGFDENKNCIVHAEGNKIVIEQK